MDGRRMKGDRGRDKERGASAAAMLNHSREVERGRHGEHDAREESRHGPSREVARNQESQLTHYGGKSSRHELPGDSDKDRRNEGPRGRRDDRADYRDRDSGHSRGRHGTPSEGNRDARKDAQQGGNMLARPGEGRSRHEPERRCEADSRHERERRLERERWHESTFSSRVDQDRDEHRGGSYRRGGSRHRESAAVRDHQGCHDGESEARSARDLDQGDPAWARPRSRGSERSPARGTYGSRGEDRSDQRTRSSDHRTRLSDHHHARSAELDHHRPRELSLEAKSSGATSVEARPRPTLEARPSSGAKALGSMSLGASIEEAKDWVPPVPGNLADNSTARWAPHRLPTPRVGPAKGAHEGDPAVTLTNIFRTQPPEEEAGRSKGEGKVSTEEEGERTKRGGNVGTDEEEGRTERARHLAGADPASRVHEGHTKEGGGGVRTKGGEQVCREEETYDAGLDFFSAEFDALRALYHATLAPPRPSVRPLDNVNACRRLLPQEVLDMLPKPAREGSRSVVAWGEGKAAAKAEMYNSVRASKRAYQQLQTKLVDVLAESLASGPLSLLRECRLKRERVCIWTRHTRGVRGSCTAFIVAVDKHMNMLLRDVDETYTVRTRVAREVLVNVRRSTGSGSKEHEGGGDGSKDHDRDGDGSKEYERGGDRGSEGEVELASGEGPPGVEPPGGWDGQQDYRGQGAACVQGAQGAPCHHGEQDAVHEHEHEHEHGHGHGHGHGHAGHSCRRDGFRGPAPMEGCEEEDGDEPIPEEGVIVTKERRLRWFPKLEHRKRHLNQVFLRGESVVMVSRACNL
eukprot:jgi/Mesvir1/13190/Mv06151-RA.1